MDAGLTHFIGGGWVLHRHRKIILVRGALARLHSAVSVPSRGVQGHAPSGKF